MSVLSTEFTSVVLYVGCGISHIFDLLQITHGRARHLISRFNVKTREYFGNTSMEAEMSLLMAGQTLASR